MDEEIKSEQPAKPEILRRLSFGQRIAEDESDALAEYFVETEQWNQLFHGHIDIVYGSKGTGKSALYSLLLRRDHNLLDRNILVIGAENPKGTPAFADLTSDPPTSEEEFRRLWKLYFLCLVADAFRDYGIENQKAQSVQETLEAAGLLERESNLRGRVRAVLDYLRQLTKFEAAESEVKFDQAGHPTGIAGRLVFRQPTRDLREAGFVSVDEMIDQANSALRQYGFDLWLLLDRLDVAFAENIALEKNALRSLFRVYLDLAAYDHITLKIFLRTDIWRRITQEGFREASHITRALTLEWDPAWLMNLIVRRLLANEIIVSHYEVDPETVLADIRQQSDLFYKIFPNQVDVGAKQPSCFDWILTRTRDGAQVHAPRELIHLLDQARTKQAQYLELGDTQPTEEKLFSSGAIKEALEEVSEVKLYQTIYSEHPEYQSYIEGLREQKTHQFPTTLASLWNVEDADAKQIGLQLVEIGFFERIGPVANPAFWVPFLFRTALDMVQGRAV